MQARGLFLHFGALRCCRTELCLFKCRVESYYGNRETETERNEIESEQADIDTDTGRERGGERDEHSLKQN